MPIFAPGYSPEEQAVRRNQADLLREKALEMRLQRQAVEEAGKRILGLDPANILNVDETIPAVEPVPPQGFVTPEQPPTPGPPTVREPWARMFPNPVLSEEEAKFWPAERLTREVTPGRPAVPRAEFEVGQEGIPERVERRPATSPEAILNFMRAIGRGGEKFVGPLERALDKEAALRIAKEQGKVGRFQFSEPDPEGNVIVKDTIKGTVQIQGAGGYTKPMTVDQMAAMEALGKVPPGTTERARSLGPPIEVSKGARLLSPTGKRLDEGGVEGEEEPDLTTTAKAQAFLSTERRKPPEKQRRQYMEAAEEILRESEGRQTRVAGITAGIVEDRQRRLAEEADTRKVALEATKALGQHQALEGQLEVLEQASGAIKNPTIFSRAKRAGKVWARMSDPGTAYESQLGLASTAIYRFETGDVGNIADTEAMRAALALGRASDPDDVRKFNLDTVRWSMNRIKARLEADKAQRPRPSEEELRERFGSPPKPPGIVTPKGTFGPSPTFRPRTP